MLGKLNSYRVEQQNIILSFENGNARIEIVTESILRLIREAQNEEHISRAIEGDKSRKVTFTVAENKEGILLQTECLKVQISHDFLVDVYDKEGNLISQSYRGERITRRQSNESWKEFVAQEGHTVDEHSGEDYKIQVVRCLNKNDCIYGLGDKTGYLNKRHYEYEMWNSDIPDPHEDNFKALYKSIPFFIVLGENCVYGIFFDNHHKTYFDMGKENEDYYVFGSDEGILDYYFISGNTMQDVVTQYTYLTGRMPLPQMWTLGYHQSRWGYESEKEVRSIAENMKKYEIPCDCIHLDIDYMDNFKVFTWKKDSYEDSDQMIQDLKNMGIKVVTIIDPGVKVEKGYSVYEEGMDNKYFVTTPEGETYVNAVWPGDSVFPDFGKPEVRRWWGDKTRFLLEKGVAGIWNDMNEPASFHGPLPKDIIFTDETRKTTHAEMHNLYGHNMAKATYEGIKRNSGKRPFVITRACYSGSQKYTSGWTGDNHSLWSHLHMAIVQMCNMGLSGFPFIGTDVGGFGSDTTPELLARWVQVGCFSPLFRNHCAKGCFHQEPWCFGEEVLNIYRKYVNLRYELLPYIYDLFRVSENTGLPIIRPLVLHYEKDENVKNLNDEFLLGENLLIAPVVEQGARSRMVYLPEGLWLDYWTKEKISGGRYIIKEAPLDICPMYVKAGTILPKYPVRSSIGADKDDTLILEIYPGEGSYVHYQDNGVDFAYKNGEYNEYEFTSKNGKLTTRMLKEAYPKYKNIVEQYV